MLEDDNDISEPPIADVSDIYNINDDNMELSEESDNDDNMELSEESEIVEFPNKAYEDFMTLVTNYNLNNEVSNAVIHFFNKHSDLSVSPLPKNIKIGKELVEKMQNNIFGFEKYCVTEFNDKKYFLFYRPIINCIKNILKISNLKENFAYKYEEKKVRSINLYNIINKFIY